MDGIGEDGLNKINKADGRTLKLLRGVLKGFRSGGIPSPIGNSRRVAMGASMAMASPLRMAAGGVIRDTDSMGQSLKVSPQGSTVNHRFESNVNIEASEDAGLNQDTLRRLDDGINLKIQGYIEEQLRPGGLLQSARKGAR